MKVLMSSNTLWFIYNFNYGLIQEIKKKDYIIVVGPKDEYLERLDNLVDEITIVNFKSKSINPLFGFVLTWKFFKVFKNLKPDIILSYTIKPNIFGNIAAGFLNIPVINTVTGLGTIFIKESFVTRVGKQLYRWSFKKSNHVFFLNATDFNYFLDKSLVKKEKCSIIPGSGVDVEKFNVDKKGNNGKIFLFVGRLLGDKGIREYIEAANKLSVLNSSFEFLLLGELGYDNPTAISEQELSKWLKNPSIKYLGKTDDMKSIYEQADIMILPSYREGLSQSLIEAAAMKLPIIATDVPGCREVVEEGKNGFLCKVKDADDLYNKMKKMISLTEQQRLDMGNYSRKKAEKEFDEKFIIQSYLEKIEENTK